MLRTAQGSKNWNAPSISAVRQVSEFDEYKIRYSQIYIVRALELARSTGITTIGLTGAHGGRMMKLCDCCLRIPSNVTMKIQEAHLALEHIFCLLVEQIYFAGDRSQVRETALADVK